MSDEVPQTQPKVPSERALVQKLCDIQSRSAVPKNSKGVHGHYRNLESILDSLKPLMYSAGLVLTFNDELIEAGGSTYIKATATVSDGADSLSSVAFAREGKKSLGNNGSQETGSASSYARRYAVCGLFSISEYPCADELDAEEHSKPQKPEAKPEPKSNAVPDAVYARQMRRLGDFCDANPSLNRGEVKTAIEVHFEKELADLSAAELEQMHEFVAEAFGREAVA